ncbi:MULTISPECIES: quinohemoprotein amine dehydrogenase subunit beta [unclassified Pseudomonas]|uniref:quinohemoprotein amine dehydrogenase subunit beta n=1 Tax=unclassified Pseudomonas TaxID=196821 RepID=UPI0005145007|nr:MULTISPECIES: quinohemoprotein amine dehydrogenase subunit beta [unclassified Pseudomonas]KGI92249.1 quinohemoprotein amine dehydrogenase [Pseudomonas sp. H2]MDD2065964.1 quinohemoprotein amine dehydrogenase subunit beta [Pseudomonas sp. 25571]UPL08831.1 quinohemoprotein amine dehydrogenase, beta subunit [Pseudomonas sp. IsoF]
MKPGLCAQLALTVAATASAWAVQADDTGPALKAGHEYLIVTNYPNNLHVVDVATDAVYKSCRMPDAFGPGTAMMAPDNRTAYVLNNHYGDLYGIDLDTCKTTFHASLSSVPGEVGKSMYSFAISPDGKEVYATVNPTQRLNDHYVVKPPRLEVFRTADGLDAKPARTFPMPRQVYLMRAADDGSLFVAGPDIYKMDVQTGRYEVALPLRNWNRPGYSAPDVLYFWPHQSARHEFSMLYTIAKFKDDKQDPATAELLYGYLSVDLKTGKTHTQEFADLTELYFTGLRSPKDPNQIYGVLNRLARYDIKERKLIKAANLEHTYYCVAFDKKGDKLYLGGTFNDLAVFDPQTLEKVKNIKLPGGDMSTTTPQVFVR